MLRGEPSKGPELGTPHRQMSFLAQHHRPSPVTARATNSLERDEGRSGATRAEACTLVV